MITRRGAGLLAGAVLLWAVGRALGVAELLVAAVAAAVLVAAGAVVVWTSTPTVSARRGVASPRILHGGTTEVLVELRNDARWDAVALMLVEDNSPPTLVEQPPRFVVGGLRPGRVQALHYDLHGAHRGSYTIGPLLVRVRDPFGVTERIRRYSATDHVIVWPRIEPLDAQLPRAAHHGSERADVRQLLNAGEEFYTMREYVTGDDLRRVHWPSTARRQRLMVRQHELAWQAQATVLCDDRAVAHRGTGADSTAEQAISAVASVVWHLADRGYQLRLLTASSTRPPPVQPWEAILDQLAQLEPSPMPRLNPALARLRSSGAEGLLVAVIAPPPPSRDHPTRHPDVAALLQAGRGFTTRIAIVVDPGWQADAADQLAQVLRAASWRAGTLPADTAAGQLADRWTAIVGSNGPVARARVTR